MDKSPGGSWPPDNPVVDFRAPPPSPIAAGRWSSSVANEEVLTDFLEHSLRVPDLILPDKFFPRQKSSISPQKIDYQLLDSSKSDAIADVIVDSVLQTGCFQLINHGIDKGLIRSVLASAMGIFQLPNDEKAAISRSMENYLWGFVDVHSSDDDNDVSEMSEEFVWCKDESLQLKMERIWPNGFSRFSEKMETLASRVEQIAATMVSFMKLHVGKSWSEKEGQGFIGGSISYLYKHCRRNAGPAPGEGLISSLRYDVVRMLIRGSDYSHALCCHLVDGCSEFHVYSKKGWVSFRPHQDALIITFGDQMQVSNDGQYKHVIGRPIFNGANEEKKDAVVSMAIVYSPPKTINSISTEENTISIGQQLRMLILLVLLFQCLVHFL